MALVMGISRHLKHFVKFCKISDLVAKVSFYSSDISKDNSRHVWVNKLASCDLSCRDLK